jgi:endonuclease/exonuclease/phosphatase family metal-dependent hydrolase
MLSNYCSHACPYINRPRNRRRSKLPAYLALLALVLLAAPHAARAQVQSQVAGGGPSLASELKVMTWNIRGGKANPETGKTQGCKPNFSPAYLIGIAKEIRRHAGLDVVALQEVYRGQVALLKPMLFPNLGMNPDIHFVATLSCGPGSADDYGIAIISRYQFVEDSRKRARLCRTSSDEPLTEWPFFTPHCPGKTQEPRVLARAIIRVDGRPIHIYNTHLPPAGGVHIGMAALILLLTGDKPDRAILLGDFYFHEGSAPYRMITRKKFRDAWLGAPHDDKDCDYEGFTHKTLNPTQRDDYVFISDDGFRVEDARVTCEGALREMFGLPRKGPSRDGEPLFTRVPDHLPLTVRLALVG